MSDPTNNPRRRRRSERQPAFLDDQSNLDAKFEAQRIAFAPLMFQAARALRDLGLLAALKTRGVAGSHEDQLVEETGLSVYAVRVLLEAGLVGGMVAQTEAGWVLTKLGYLTLVDPMTRANMDFTHDVCYRAAFQMQESLQEGRPVGLAEFGDYKTVYEALAHLPEHVRKSWFAFDHYYSDGVFEELMPTIFASKPAKILDVGGNTGKFSRACCAYDPAVQMTIADLPGQLNEALEIAGERGLSDRIHGHALDILDPSTKLPEDHDLIWMSQFLDCFSEDEIVSILRKAVAVMGPETPLLILETFWDQQRHEASRYSVVQTSLYFTAVANGNSKMYHSERMRACVEQAGLRVVNLQRDIGVAHSLMRCQRAS